MISARLLSIPALLTAVILQPQAPLVGSAPLPAPVVWDVAILPEENSGQARFSPPEITIAVGDSILWTSRDPADLHNVNIPALGHASEEFNNGESDLVTFDAAGTYSYVCDPHPYMKGKVIVIEPGKVVSWAYVPAAPVKVTTFR